KEFHLPKFYLDLKELAEREGRPYQVKPKNPQQANIAEQVRELLEALDLGHWENKEGNPRYLALEPDPLDFVRSMQGLTLMERPPRLSTLSVQEAFMVYFKVCILCGLVLSSPWVFYQIWSFVAAGLYPHDKRLVNVYLPVSLGLFLVGVFTCEIFVI